MEAQGIRGPQYKFLHGTTKEAAAMVAESVSRPMEVLSHDITSRVLPYDHAWIKSYGRSLLKWHGPRPQLVVNEPELIKEILNNREGAYIKAPLTGYLLKLLGDGLVTTEGKKWARQRKIANHAFRAQHVKGMIPAIVVSVEDMLRKLEECEGKEVDLFQEFTVMTSDVISRTAFGSSYIQGRDIFTNLDKLAAISARNRETIEFPLLRIFLQDHKEASILEHAIRDIVLGLIKSREESNRIGDSDGYGSDLFGSLIKANHDENQDSRISVEDVIDECKTFYFAGKETSNSLLSWTVFLLAINTDWQDKAREETTELFGNTSVIMDDTIIAKLKIMTMILNESLRLYPPVVMITRKVSREVKLGDLVLPAGLELFISPLIVHHDHRLWGEDTHLFKPERFSEGVARATNNAMSFLPFGVGPRYCVGQSVAMMEAKIALSMILRRYSFTLSPAYVHAPIRHLTLMPQHGVQVILSSQLV